MGYFTWRDCQDRRKSVGYDKPVFVICPDNTVIEDNGYNGYGIFHGHDIFELVVDWNRPHLKEIFEKKHPDDFGFSLKAVAIAAMESDEKAEETARELWKDPSCCFVKEWKRNIGIAIACGDEDNENLPCPIKMSATRPRKPYADLKASYQCQ